MSECIVSGATGPRGPIGPAGINGLGRSVVVTENYPIVGDEGALWVDLSSGSVAITLASLQNDARIWVKDYKGLAAAPVKITVVGVIDGVANATIIDLPYNDAELFYSLELNLWSVSL